MPAGARIARKSGHDLARLRRRSVLKIAGAGAALPLLAACGTRTPTRGSAGSGAPAAPKDLAVGPDQAYDCTPGKEAWRSPGPPKRGGTLVKASLDFSHLDPTTPGGAANEVAPQVYNTLLSFRGCFFEDTFLNPDLAKSWTASQDGLTWTLHLREDARWHDKPPLNGRAFTSGDVAWMLEYQKAGGLGRNFWAGVDKHQEPDRNTIVLTLKSPDAEYQVCIGAELVH
ncbi:MAG TPA: ABC transporter substrate-binding protein [Dehalococcoidia bacterium]|nr:ABC transporter substrate-binding protein [Dehalococcoidia bacterium]